MTEKTYGRAAASYREDITGLIRKCDELTRERDEARAERVAADLIAAERARLHDEALARVAELEAENDKLAGAARHLGRSVVGLVRAMYAARIDFRRGDHKAASEWIANSLPGVWDDEPWNGTETGDQWFGRTNTPAESPATPA
jgi:hypothetical protein